jgi:hypothetical protein
VVVVGACGRVREGGRCNVRTNAGHPNKIPLTEGPAVVGNHQAGHGSLAGLCASEGELHLENAHQQRTFTHTHTRPQSEGGWPQARVKRADGWSLPQVIRPSAPSLPPSPFTRHTTPDLRPRPSNEAGHISGESPKNQKKWEEVGGGWSPGTQQTTHTSVARASLAFCRSSRRTTKSEEYRASICIGREYMDGSMADGEQEAKGVLASS